MKNIAAALMLAVCAMLPISAHTASPTGATQEATQTQDAKVRALQAEVQVMRDFTQHILSTVYYTLGTVVVVLFAMVGFGWYQNVRVYERDKEALRHSLTKTIEDESASSYKKLGDEASERFSKFDENIAQALKRTHQRMNDSDLFAAASLFRAAYMGDTPRTDFAVLCHRIEHSAERVSDGALGEALSVVLNYLEKCERVDSATRTQVLRLANLTESRDAAHAQRIRELLQQKPDGAP